ncbi:MAG TPA: hypothetical protein VE870_01490 [Bacteroidales bacterium]|nr:hypothetical protein [Bacteroidales bacterium]
MKQYETLPPLRLRSATGFDSAQRPASTPLPPPLEAMGSTRCASAEAQATRGQRPGPDRLKLYETI